MLRKLIRDVALLCTLFGACVAYAASAPNEIKIGTLYASSGPIASISMPVYKGLKLWVKMVNAKGGVFVKPYGKKYPSNSSPMMIKARRQPPRLSITS